MKLITTLTLLILISGWTVTGLAKTAVTTTFKVAEVPFKVVGSIVDGGQDADESENEEERYIRNQRMVDTSGLEPPTPTMSRLQP